MQKHTNITVKQIKTTECELIFFHFDLSWLLMMRGGVRTVSSFSRAASSSVCGPCRTSSYFT